MKKARSLWKLHMQEERKPTAAWSRAWGAGQVRWGQKVKVIQESESRLRGRHGIVSKRIKAIKFADKSEFGWQTVNEYLSNELASDLDDEKGCIMQRGGRKRKSGTSFIVSYPLWPMEAPSLLFQKCLWIRKDLRLQVIIEMQSLPVAWDLVLR